MAGSADPLVVVSSTCSMSKFGILNMAYAMRYLTVHEVLVLLHLTVPYLTLSYLTLSYFKVLYFTLCSGRFLSSNSFRS